MLATHYAAKAQPAIAKKLRAQKEHVTPPLNGLSLATRFGPGDPQTATILSNFNVEEDRISTRAGYRKLASRGTAAVWHMVPYYGTPTRLAAASNHELWDAQSGALLKGGFTSDDWHWSSWSNLGDREYTIMVNGADGVWSWNGGTTATGATKTITNLSGGAGANPAVATVALADIATFTNGMSVNITGADASHAAANGVHVIASVNVPANTFQLVGVNLTAASGPQTTGMTATPTGSFVKETITAPVGEGWIAPQIFHIVITHMNRLFFADPSNLAIYYLPLLQKAGALKMLPLNSVFRRGGHIKAMYTWTIDGGVSLNDQLVIFSSNGECVIYGGTDPDVDFKLSGIFRFDAPMSKHSVVNYGGELYVMISTGLVPLSTMIKAEGEKLGTSEKAVLSIFLKEAINYRDDPGWQTFLNPSSGRLVCNIPQGADNKYRQLIRHMPKAIWAEWNDIPAHCWGWIDPFLYFADDKGNVYEMHPSHLNDDGAAIRVDVQMAWNQFKTSSDKHFKAIQSYLSTDGDPHPTIDVKVNYDYSAGINTPDLTRVVGGAIWDVAIWDVDTWGEGERALTIWNGVAASGAVGAVRLTALVDNCKFSVNGWDVMFEEGGFNP